MPDKKEVIEKALKNSNPKDSQKTQEEILVEQMCEGLSTYDKKKRWGIYRFIYRRA